MADTTIVGLFDHYEDAGRAVQEILQSGIPREKISLLANTLNGDHPPLTTNPAYAREEVDTKDQAQPGVVTGAEFGIGVGGILGVLVGSGAIVIPGIGPLVAAGVWAAIAAGAAAGGVVGGAIGMLTSQGITDNDAHLYAEGLKRGGTLVTVVAGEESVDPINAIYKRLGAVDIEKRSATWTAEGWVTFDPYTGPLSTTEAAADRIVHGARDDEEHHEHHHLHQDKPGVPNAGAANQTTRYAEDELRQ